MKNKKLATATFVYWFLLVYIIAALVWWFIALQEQNMQMRAAKIAVLSHENAQSVEKIASIVAQARRKTAQYIGEGSTFLLLIVVCAVFVYGAVRRQFKLQQQQQNFMMAVTHELKTPIAVTKLNLETLQRHELNQEKRKKLIDSALQETNRLNSLATNILVASQLEGGKYQLLKEPVNLSSISLHASTEFQNRFAERPWKNNIQPDIFQKGDSLLLQMLVNNLIENAVKYSPKGSPIDVELYSENRVTIFSVRDRGPGIAQEEKKKIFDKFYRIGNEETRKAQGTGLGLYLCKKIAKDHSAHIAVSDNSPSGTIFTVKFQ